MKIGPSLVVLTLLTIGVSVALEQPGERGKKSQREAPRAPSSPSDRSATTATYPPQSTETQSGKFSIKCTLSHQRQVDPIVKPGPKGTLSGHLHDFFGNRSTDSDSTYDSMIASPTTCGLNADTSRYWTPSLLRPDGSVVKPVAVYPMYRNVPVKYGSTVPFPPDFRVIAGGVGTFPSYWWNCGADSSDVTSLETPPSCGSDRLVATLEFPKCWDGVHTDSADHRSHVVSFQDNRCPQDHPVKLPRLSLKIY